MVMTDLYSKDRHVCMCVGGGGGGGWLSHWSGREVSVYIRYYRESIIPTILLFVSYILRGRR